MNEALLRVIGASVIPDPVLRAVCGPKMPRMAATTAASVAPPAGGWGNHRHAPDPAATLASAVIASRGIRVSEQEAVAIYREICRLMEAPNE